MIKTALKRKQAMTTASTLYFVLGLFVCSSTGMAHGINLHVVERSVSVEVTHEDGSPLQEGEAKVYAPLNTDQPFLHGKTDEDGHFTFFPDSTGVWRVVVGDSMGHAVTRNVTVASSSEHTTKHDHPITSDHDHKAGHDHYFSRLQGVIVGLSVIFGIWGLVSMSRSCKATATGKER